ncbi:NADH dehydrogenase subunit 4 [Melampsora americana]|nr:NADH dehydrogenase subunit 4 [Melampsora americana]
MSISLVTIETNYGLSIVNYKNKIYSLNNINNKFNIIMLLLETLLLAVFLVLDVLLFIFFERLFGSSNKVRASFYLFLYTLLGSLFMLLSIIVMSSIMGTTDFDALSKANFSYTTQLFLFYGIFIAFAVKTPLTFSTLRTIDIKELIAYSSVSHAAVYLIGAFSNTIQGIEGAIVLGLAHGFVSPGLFICAGGILYDRSSTRLITYYRGMAQIMPIFSILFFLSLGNSGTPLTLNFLGEFMSLYGAFERMPILGILASTSIVLSAAYTIFMYNRIAFGENIGDVTRREFILLLVFVIFTVLFGIYPAILDGLHYSVSSLIYNIN